MNKIKTTVRDLKIGDHLLGSNREVIAVGLLGLRSKPSTYYVKTRTSTGKELVGHWNGSTTMVVNRPKQWGCPCGAIWDDPLSRSCSPTCPRPPLFPLYNM